MRTAEQVMARMDEVQAENHAAGGSNEAAVARMLGLATEEAQLAFKAAVGIWTDRCLRARVPLMDDAAAGAYAGMLALVTGMEFAVAAASLGEGE